MLRDSLNHDSGPLVSLEEEMGRVETFVDIQRFRHGPELKFDVQISDQARRCAVPTFAIQTLVENAIKHGIERAKDADTIAVCAEIRGDQLEVNVEDDGPGFAKADLQSGIGLSNLRERITVLFEDAGTLSTTDSPLGGARVTLTLPCRDPRGSA